MIDHGETGLLYRFEEVEMLAASVCRLFSDSHLAQKFSEQGQIRAAGRHHQKENAGKLLHIYSEIEENNNI
jgi:hypothetical protein